MLQPNREAEGSFSAAAMPQWAMLTLIDMVALGRSGSIDMQSLAI